MAKSFAFVTLIVSALCFSWSAQAAEKFFVEGKTYCDPCRLEFETNMSQPLGGATLILECKNETTDTVTYKKEAVSDHNGFYSMVVDGNHEEEICTVTAVKSVHPECNEPMSGMESDRIVLTNNMGSSSVRRYVNSLGFMPKKIITLDLVERCKALVLETLQSDELWQ